MQVQVISFPQANPGKCYYCGSSSKEWYLDTGMSFEFYGAVIFCNECLNHLMTVSGYMSRDTAARLTLENKELGDKNGLLEAKVIALESAINALKVAGYADDNLDSVLDSLDSALDDSNSSDETSDDVSEGEESVESREDGPSESDSVEGLADVSPIELGEIEPIH